MLWIEIVAFQTSVVTLIFTTIYYFFYDVNLVKDKSPDYILCRDESKVDKSLIGRYRADPTYHLFDSAMREMAVYRHKFDFKAVPSLQEDGTHEDKELAEMKARLAYFKKFLSDKANEDKFKFYLISG